MRIALRSNESRNKKRYNTQGQYPAITSGTVVERAKVLVVMEQQLLQQGLSAKETADFIEYWKDNIPNKPYVRLTWLTLDQINHLAPLRVSPVPNTVIRVFLDMEGYDKKVDLPAQQLSSTPRNGFTLVEWGGLSHKKLY